MLKRVAALLRSMLVGGLATIVDLGALFVMVTLFGISPRIASVPALLLAASVQFMGQRHFAFRAGGGDARRQAMRFACVHAVTLLLNAVVFDVVFRLAGAHAPYWALRLVVGNAVYLTWSFPMLRRVFAEASVRPSRP
jgi:putative flippase GtrA